MPVIVIAMVKTYLTTIKLPKNLVFFANKSNIMAIKIQIFDWLVKYKSRLVQCEYPSVFAVIKDMVIPANAHMMILIFNKVEIVFLIINLKIKKQY